TIFHYNFSFINQLLKEGGMMDHFVIATEFGVFVFENIEAVRTGSYNFFDAVHVQGLDILIGHHLKQELIAGAACRITGAHFLFSEDGIIDAHLVEDCGECSCDFLRPSVEAAGTSHPEKDIGSFTGRHQFSHCSYFHILSSYIRKWVSYCELS